MACGIVLTALLLAACDRSVQPATLPIPSLLPPSLQTSSVPSQEQSRTALQRFVSERMNGPDGVYTNFRDTEQSGELATGHEVLSESTGLLMRYYALQKLRSEFDAEWAKAKRVLDMKSGFSYRYSPNKQKRYPLNAAVDDLRIIRALYEGAHLFQDTGLKVEADTYGKRFIDYNTKSGYMYDFYDETYKTTNSFITLCYTDLKTMQLLPMPDEQKTELTRNMLGVVQNGYLSEKFPFYETRYDYKNRSYSSDNINMVESLLTVLALSEVGKHQPASVRYLKEHVKAGTLFGQYTKEGKPTNDIRSTAIYAIAAMIGVQVGDRALYEDALRRMGEFQVKDPISPLYGGYGDPATQAAFSFDNLMALLAHAY